MPDPAAACNSEGTILRMAGWFPAQPNCNEFVLVWKARNVRNFGAALGRQIGSISADESPGSTRYRTDHPHTDPLARTDVRPAKLGIGGDSWTRFATFRWDIVKHELVW